MMFFKSNRFVEGPMLLGCCCLKHDLHFCWNDALKSFRPLMRVFFLAFLVGSASCASTTANSLTKQQQIEICDRHERLEITRAEAVKLLGLPPLTKEEAEGGIAGWLTYCRLLER